MIQAVFISDLHLHPEDSDLLARFDAWLQWAVENVQTVYILGDFFHAWAGDDAMDAWSGSIADRLARFAQHGIGVFFMPGNRDFLLGDAFLKRAKMQLMREPFIVNFGAKRVLLTHGDGYCRDDRLHQWFRWVTRNPWFVSMFLRLPLTWRLALVRGVRARSMRRVQGASSDVVVSVLLDDALRHQADVVIHGHTHRPTMVEHDRLGLKVQHMVLSDWDANPWVLCYNPPKGFYWHV